jgi:hypothetical protein
MMMLMGIMGLGLLCLVCLLFMILRSKKKGAAAVTRDDADPIKDSVPVVKATVQGENAKEVLESGYFQNVFPGVKVVTKRAGTNPAAALPKNAPAFLLLTDSTGTITGVDANNMLWNAPADVPAKK